MYNIMKAFILLLLFIIIITYNLYQYNQPLTVYIRIVDVIYNIVKYDI